jgi:Na+/melibiose symporter-like transporter
MRARRRENLTPVSTRQKLFLLAALALAIAAMFVGMIWEWMGDEPQALISWGTLLALAVLCLSFALGVAFSHRLNVTRRAQADNPAFQAGDGRAVLTFIWWPITVISVVVPLIGLYSIANSSMGAGAGLPTGIILVLAVFGFIILPPVVTESFAEYKRRGVRGFWTTAKNTEWGDGGAT